MQLSANILSGIFTGNIRYWNDTAIRQANPTLASKFPYQRIRVVVEDNDSDTNIISSRFLALKSTAFATAYSVPSDGLSKVDFSSRIDANWLTKSSNDNSVNAAVTHFDGSIGFYNLMNGLPSAPIVKYCTDDLCAHVVDPTDGGASLHECEKDPVTLVNPYPSLLSYDFMQSQSPSCYPIAGTVDMSIRTTDNTASNSGSLRFAGWFFHGDSVVSPLTTYQASVTSTATRQSTYSAICDIKVGGKAFGYTYCGYRDCTWASGDYIQLVSDCDASSVTRTVSYQLNASSICRNVSPPPSTTIQCTYVPNSSGIGSFGNALCALGVFICSTILIWTFLVRNSKVIRKSQPIFIFIFIFGTILMNFTILAYIGPNTNSSCLARPWIFNLASSIMFAPLIMKLRRVDKLINNPKLKKIKITDWDVLKSTFALLMVDVILVLIWTFTNTPRMITVSTSYSGALASVNDNVCSTGLNNTMEDVLLVWKACLLCFGVYLAVTTWKAPPDLAEAKTFAVAIYNVAVLGGLSYFLSGFLASSSSIVIGFVLIYLGLFLCSTIAVVLVMTSKLMAAEFDSSKISPFVRFSSRLNEPNSVATGK